jgi:hypothetical protein
LTEEKVGLSPQRNSFFIFRMAEQTEKDSVNTTSSLWMDCTFLGHHSGMFDSGFTIVANHR